MKPSKQTLTKSQRAKQLFPALGFLCGVLVTALVVFHVWFFRAQNNGSQIVVQENTVERELRKAVMTSREKLDVYEQTLKAVLRVLDVMENSNEQIEYFSHFSGAPTFAYPAHWHISVSEDLDHEQNKEFLIVRAADDPVYRCAACDADTDQLLIHIEKPLRVEFDYSSESFDELVASYKTDEYFTVIDESTTRLPNGKLWNGRVIAHSEMGGDSLHEILLFRETNGSIVRLIYDFIGAESTSTEEEVWELIESTIDFSQM